MIEKEPKPWQPHFSNYIKDHWEEVKDLEFKQLKLVVSQNCQNLTQKEEKHLSIWLRNQRTSRRRLAERQTKKEADQSTISHTKQTNQGFIQEQKNAQIYVDQAREIFTQLARIKPEERYDFCFAKFEANQLLFMKFMKECQRLPTPDFLNIVIQICENTQPQVFQTQLFIRVCALFKDGLLSVPAALISNGLKYLAFETHDSEAAQGLLKLAYYNDVSFKSFPLDALLEFQRKYSLEFQCFYNHLGAEVDSQVIACLPPTCFLFTMPFYTALKQSGSDLHQMIDPDYLSFVIEILSYSFEDDQKLFSAFLKLFKEINAYTFGRGIDLKNLLVSIHNEEIIRNPLFFGSLKKHIMLFKHLFEQFKEKRITTLNENIIIELLGVDEEQYLLKSQCPRIVTTLDEAEDRLMAFWDHFYAYNKAEIPLTFQPQVPDCVLLKKVLSLFKINCLNPPQMIAFQLMKDYFQQKRLFQQFPTGVGKTTLSLIWIIYSLLYSKTRSITCYDSLELCEHDYEKLFTETSSLYPSIALISNEEHLKTFVKADIIFVTTDNLVKLMEHPFIKDEFSTFQLVLDEFDCCLFDCKSFANETDGKNYFQELINSIVQFNSLVAFTGSPLEIIHKSAIENHLAGSTLIYPSFASFADSENVCHGIFACSKRIDHTNAIINVCKNQAAKTPVIIIIDEKGFKSLQNQLSVAKIPWKNLSTANPSEISSFLSSVLTVPQNGNYAVALLNTRQGRGLDIPTSSAIENEGGIYVLIGVLPKSFRELEQFKGRTRRMGNKGQYSVILWEETSLTAEYFLKDHLNTASKLELQQLSRQYAPVKALPLIGSKDNELKLQNDENEGSKDAVMAKENMKGAENKNSKQNKDLVEIQKEEHKDDDNYMQKNYEECKSCGKEDDKDHNCKKGVARKPQVPTKNSKSKTLGKHKRDQSKTNSPLKELSTNKRIQKQAQKTKDKDTNQQEKENNQPPAEKKAYVRVNETLKVVIPSNELQEFKEQNSDNNENVLDKNQQQQSKNPSNKAQQSSPQTRRQQIIANNKNKQRKQIDEGYFAGYSEPDIHTEMLNDIVRVEQYRKAINETCKGKVVLDLGCGTGVLSVLAIKAGASKVYAVDGADIEGLMNEEFKKLIKEGTVEFINCSIEKLAQEEVPRIPKVDVIVSEWMGYFLLFENMISSYICAIKTFLKPEGLVLPSHAAMYLDVASYNFNDNELAEKHCKTQSCKTVWLEQCKADYLLSDHHASIITFDFTERNMQNPPDSNGFASNFEISVAKAGAFNAFVGSFSTQLAENVLLDTSPASPQTHWKQSLFFLSNAIQVSEGDVIEGTVKVSADEDNYRNLIVKFTYKVQGNDGSQAEECFTFE